MTKLDNISKSISLKVNAIDSLRGYAILLVLLSHTFSHIPGLIWPIKRLLLMGVYGVQLFFIASALTLMMSWSKGKGDFIPKTKGFLIRRFFRIAPLYYLAIPFYLWFNSNASLEFNWSGLIATLFFFNAWFSDFAPPNNNWVPVPGGWSISVEFAFYLVFPILMIFVRKLSDSLVLLGFSVALAVFFNIFSFQPGSTAAISGANLFAYYAPPNQFFIFSLGICLFWLVNSKAVQNFVTRIPVTTDWASFGMLVFIFCLSFYGQHKFFELSPFSLPTHLLISVFFVMWAILMLLKSSRYAVNKYVIKTGKLSFGIYLIHFAALDMVDKFLQFLGWVNKEGIAGIAYFLVLTSLALICSYLVAFVVYRLIEAPCIELGHRLALHVTGNKKDGQVGRSSVEKVI